MNIVITLLLIFLSIVILGSIAVTILNICAMIIFQFVKTLNRSNLRYIIGVCLLTLIHLYVFLSIISLIILLCYACTTSILIFKIILWVLATLISIVFLFTAYKRGSVRMRDKTAESYESINVHALAINAFLSSIGFLILAIFPSLISYGWGWIENILDKLI